MQMEVYKRIVEALVRGGRVASILVSEVVNIKELKDELDFLGYTLEIVPASFDSSINIVRISLVA